MMYTTTTIGSEDMMTEQDKKTRIVKSVIKFAVGGLVEIFVGAVTNSVIGRVDGSKMAKLGAKAGGFLAGMWLGDKVSDYICSGYDEVMAQLEALKETIEEEG